MLMATPSALFDQLVRASATVDLGEFFRLRGFHAASFWIDQIIAVRRRKASGEGMNVRRGEYPSEFPYEAKMPGVGEGPKKDR
jgi:hypothetical protein